MRKASTTEYMNVIRLIIKTLYTQMINI